MQADEFPDFSDAIESLFVGMGAESTKMTFKAYWIGLSDLSLEEVQIAVCKAIQTCKAVPKPAELRELIHGKQQDRAELAWLEIQRAIPLGPYKHIDFCGDRVINATIRSLGGWPSFLARFTSATEEKWARQDFIRTYERLSGCGLSDEALGYLPGLTEMQTVPVRIGSNKPTESARIGMATQRVGVRKGEPI
jgi:hypothetical protein